MRIVTLPGVFSPHSDSELLADAVRRLTTPGHRVLDLCAGSGVVSLAAAEAGGEPTAVDVSRRALMTVRLNARRRGFPVRTRRGHLFDTVPGERFDIVAANPPYVPSPRDGLPPRGFSRAWEAGPDGRLILDEICARLPDHLEPGGAALLTHSSLIDVDRTVALLTEAGLKARVTERVRGALGPLMRAQQERGLVGPDADHEDVVIIRADAPE